MDETKVLISFDRHNELLKKERLFDDKTIIAAVNMHAYKGSFPPHIDLLIINETEALQICKQELETIRTERAKLYRDTMELSAQIRELKNKKKSIFG